MSNCINHVAFVLDTSGSMEHLEHDVIKVVDSQIKHLAELSQKVEQETRISVYTFSNSAKNVVFDKDVLRLPSIKSLYSPGGSTALIAATLLTIADLKETCQKYGEHAFLIYVLTDGGENCGGDSQKLASVIRALPDNWTLATFVPSQVEKFTTEKQGFPKDNIAIWSTDAGGMSDVGNKIKETTTSYMQARSVGTRSIKNLFSLNTASLSEAAVRSKLTELKSSEYSLLPVSKESPIKEFVISFTKDYIPGSAYYQLTKSEKIQAAKQICVQDKKNGKIYTGQPARDLLGLPNHEVKVSPVSHDKYNIFVQSLSINRKLVSGTNVLVMN